MHEPKRDLSNEKRDLRDMPATSLRDTDVESALQDPAVENPDAQRVRSGPGIVKPGGASRTPGQNTHQ